jgi:hypothetical protein
VGVRILDDFGLLLLLAALLAIGLIVRRLVLRRGGAVLDLCIRSGNSRHWVLGLARYSGDRLQWYRAFSFSPRPSSSFRRAELRVIERRTPSRGEAAYFAHGALVFECRQAGRRLDLALPQTAVNGFQAWLEALPPGTSPMARREREADGRHGASPRNA